MSSCHKIFVNNRKRTAFRSDWDFWGTLMQNLLKTSGQTSNWAVTRDDISLHFYISRHFSVKYFAFESRRTWWFRSRSIHFAPCLHYAINASASLNQRDKIMIIMMKKSVGSCYSTCECFCWSVFINRAGSLRNRKIWKCWVNSKFMAVIHKGHQTMKKSICKGFCIIMHVWWSSAHKLY